MLQVDVIRGKDSTGVAIIKKKGYEVVKKVGVPQELLDSRKYQEKMKGANSILIGHNRWATVGKTNSANAHPFDVGSIVGVHNGTLENKYEVDPKTEYDTDSEALYAHIQKHGIVPTISKLRGAWALVWWDEEVGSLNFLRNKERPMFLAYNKDHTTLYWASEAWMLYGIAAREGIPLDKVWELPVDVHITFDIPTVGTDPVTELSRMDVKGALPFIKAATTTVGGTTGGVIYKPNYHSLLNREFDAQAGLTICEGNSVYIRYLVKGHLCEEFRVYFPSLAVANEHAGKATKIVGKYIISQNNVHKYLRCDVVYKDVDEEVEEILFDIPTKPISRDVFETQYKECAWCSEKMEYEDDWFISSAGVCVCGDCRKVPEVKEYLQIH